MSTRIKRGWRVRMRATIRFVAVAMVLGLAGGRSHAGQAQAQQGSAAGRWVVTTDFFGTPQLWVMKLTQDGEKLGGDFSGDKLEGTMKGGAVRFFAKDDQGGSEDLTGTLSGEEMKGSIIFADGSNKEHPTTHEFTAKRVPARPSGPPKKHEFTPTVFYRQFSPFNKPVL